jgi:hypothetical protein
MNANLFADRLKNMFRSDLDELWTDGPFADHESVMLMDNYPSHVTDGNINNFTHPLVNIFTLALHITNIFHKLDL